MISQGSKGNRDGNRSPWSPWRCPFLVCIYTCVFRLEAEGELRGNAFDSLCLTAASNLIKLGTREINPEILPRARRCWKGGLVHQSITSVAVATSMSLSLSLSLSGRVPVMKGVRNSPPTLAMLWNIDANNMKTNAINSLFSFCLFFSSKLSKRETN